jgi:hypothetical protein
MPKNLVNRVNTGCEGGGGKDLLHRFGEPPMFSSLKVTFHSKQTS